MTTCLNSAHPELVEGLLFLMQRPQVRTGLRQAQPELLGEGWA